MSGVGVLHLGCDWLEHCTDLSEVAGQQVLRREAGVEPEPPALCSAPSLPGLVWMHCGAVYGTGQQWRLRGHRRLKEKPGRETRGELRSDWVEPG